MQTKIPLQLNTDFVSACSNTAFVSAYAIFLAIETGVHTWKSVLVCMEVCPGVCNVYVKSVLDV